MFVSRILQSIVQIPVHFIVKHEQACQIHSFLKTLPADKLWKGVTSVSNAGRKRGRGKALKKMMGRNLNIGQVIGVGQANIEWPGLTTSVLKGKDLVKPKVLAPDLDRDERLLKLRESMRSFRSLKFKTGEVGWSGNTIHGRHFGPPDPVGDDVFYGFDSICLEMKTVLKMTSNFGRTRSVRGLMFVGNGNGLAGFGYNKGVEVKAVLRASRNRAGQKLIYFKMCENRTVYHDFCTQFGRTKIFVSKKPEGYGLMCHRAIKAMCQLIGIKDIHAKIEGPINMRHLINAFLIGLLKQKSYEEMAEDKRLHLVEMCKENSYYPKVLASPKSCRTEEEIDPNEDIDYMQYCHEGKVVLKRKYYPPFYTKLPSWQIYLKKQERIRNKEAVKRELIAKYGEVKSFLGEKYPEARVNYAHEQWLKKRQESE